MCLCKSKMTLPTLFCRGTVADTLSCPSRKSTGVTSDVNEGFIQIKSQSHCLSPRFDWGKTCHVEKRNNLLTEKKKDGRNLRKCYWGGIPLPGRTGMQQMSHDQNRTTKVTIYNIYKVCGLSRRLIALLPVPVSYATVSGHAQYQSPRTSSPQWNSAIIDIINSTSAFPALMSVNSAVTSAAQIRQAS